MQDNPPFCRSIDEEPRDDALSDDQPGYLTPQRDLGDSDYLFEGATETLLEDWLEPRPPGSAVRGNRRAKVPVAAHFAADGTPDPNGRAFWFLKGKFAFCPDRHDQPSPNARERSKLAGLSADGRSSATTNISTTLLEGLNAPEAAWSLQVATAQDLPG